MKIVSANYFDRDSALRWLVRDASQRPSERNAVSAVVATGVAFCPSSDYEQGFGCAVIAQCETAEVRDVTGEDLVGAERLGFQPWGLEFHVKSSNQHVDVVDKLILLPDGTMYGVLAVEKPVQEPARDLVTA